MTDDVEAWENHLMGELNHAIEDRNAAEAEVHRLRKLIREAVDDPYATLTVSLNERMRAALGWWLDREYGERSPAGALPLDPDRAHAGKAGAAMSTVREEALTRCLLMVADDEEAAAAFLRRVLPDESEMAEMLEQSAAAAREVATDEGGGQ